MLKDDTRQPFLPQIPLEIIRSRNPLDHRVFFECAMLDHARNDRAFELPTMEELARICGMSLRNLRYSFARLKQTGYFELIDRGPKGMKHLVRMTYFRIPTMAEIVKTEGVQMLKSQTVTAKRTDDGGTDVSLHNTYSPSPETIAYHSRCRNRDSYGDTLADIQLLILWKRAGQPSDESMLIALREVEHYRPKNGLIGNILTVFERRFLRDENGRYTGELDSHRKNILVPKHRKPAPAVPHPEAQTVSIYPTQQFPAARIDALCDELNKGGRILKGDAPIYFSDLPCLDIVDGIYIVLTPGVRHLVRKGTGQWGAEWRSVKEIARLEVENRA